MQEINHHQLITKNKGETNKLLPVIILWSAVIFVGIISFVSINAEFIDARNFYLVPWILITAVVLTAPSIYLYFRGEIHLISPINFSSLVIFFTGICAWRFLDRF